jgi:hypothetical protein
MLHSELPIVGVAALPVKLATGSSGGVCKIDSYDGEHVHEV